MRRDLHAVIEEFLAAAEDGRARDVDGERYGRDELRMLRGALSHVDSALGSRRVDQVRQWQVQALVRGLSDSGLPPHRVEALVDALRSLYAYAIQRRLVRVSPVVGLAPAPEPPFEAIEPGSEPSSEPAPERTPTQAVLTLAEEATMWTVRLVMIAMLVLTVGVVLGLA